MVHNMSDLVEKVKVIKPEFTDRDAFYYLVNMDYVAEGLELFGLDYGRLEVAIFEL